MEIQRRIHVLLSAAHIFSWICFKPVCVCVRVIDSVWCCGAECVVLLSMRGHPSFSVIHEQPVLEVLSAGYNRAYLYFGLVDHTTSSITVSALIEFVYLVDISVLGKYDFH